MFAETYLKATELDEIAAVLDALNGPLLKEINIETPVCLRDENGECAGYILHEPSEGYVYAASDSFEDELG